MSQFPSRQLLVAIHDVTPAHERQLERLYHLLEECGVRRYALLVVPNWHGAWPLAEFPEFTAQLRERVARGAEMVLHGLRHDEAGLPRPLRHRIRTFGRTDREGEFASLAPSQAAARIAQGLATLRSCGLDPIGFVPPAWLLGPDLLRVVREAGLAFTESQGSVFALGEGRTIRAPTICWATRRTYLAVGSVVVATLRVRLERARPMLRVAFHPPDVDSPLVYASCRRTLEGLLRDRDVIGYEELLRTPVPAA